MWGFGHTGGQTLGILPPSVGFIPRDESQWDFPSFSSCDPTFPFAEPQQLRRGFHRLRGEIGPQRGAEPAPAWESVDEVSESSECSPGNVDFREKSPKGTLTPQKRGIFPLPRKTRNLWDGFCSQSRLSYWIVHPQSLIIDYLIPSFIN